MISKIKVKYKGKNKLPQWLFKKTKMIVMIINYRKFQN